LPEIDVDDYIKDPDYPAAAYFQKPHPGSQASCAQHPLISADLELNAVLTIQPVSVIKIPVADCRSKIAVRNPALHYIGIHHVMVHNFKLYLTPLLKREFLSIKYLNPWN
jgi:hypothetical protein